MVYNQKRVRNTTSVPALMLCLEQNDNLNQNGYRSEAVHCKCLVSRILVDASQASDFTVLRGYCSISEMRGPKMFGSCVPSGVRVQTPSGALAPGSRNSVAVVQSFQRWLRCGSITSRSKRLTRSWARKRPAKLALWIMALTRGRVLISAPK